MTTEQDTATAPPVTAPAPPRHPLDRINLLDPRVQLTLAIAIGVVPPLSIALGSWTSEGLSFGSIEDGISLTGNSLGIVAAMLLLIAASGSPPEEFGIVRCRPGRDLLVGLLWTAPQLWVPGVILGAVAALPGVSQLDAAISPRPIDASVRGGVAVWGVYTLGLVCNSFAEELVIRAVIFTRIRLLTGSVVKAAIWSSALFASYHVYQGVLAAAHVFVCGLLFALAFAIHRSVWVVIVTHTAVNIAIAVFSS